MQQSRADIITQLKKDVLFQRFSVPRNKDISSISIPPLTNAFHFNIFPLGAVHEFICNDASSSAASTGFISALLHSLMINNGVAVWFTNAQTFFPPAFAQFGIQPDKIIFIHISNQKDLLYAMEEALKCEGLAAVIGVVKELNFKQSRRLQLACEKSRVTGFIICMNPRKINTTACVARWNINATTSLNDDGLPGVGFPVWNIELQKVKNGKPGSWTFSWQADRFIHIQDQTGNAEIYLPQKKAV